MAKNLSISILLDYYGEMLTEKQREVVELYYNEDLSLAEIAEHASITRQGVRDSIKRAEFQLLEFEQKLHLRERFDKIQAGLAEIADCATALQEENRRLPYSEKLWESTQRIIEVATSLNV